MCGIFGYVGPRATEQILIESLKRLEYRGYDSWGLALARENGLDLRREVGRITRAETGKTDVPAGGWWGGIAHTRWATHGPPTVKNAHPHVARGGNLAIVHNGIVENHSSLREMLQSQGCSFTSETDTEVIAHLIDRFLGDGLALRDAFLNALKLVEGAYGIAVICSEAPGVILLARKGSPMVIGVGDHEMMVASDPAALVAHTRQVVYIEDGEAATLRADGFEIHDMDATPIAREVQEIAFDLPAIERGGYAHFMLKEIFEQPESIHNSFRGRIIRSEGTAKLGGVSDETLRRTKRCHILACGTSWHAGLIGKYLFENLAHLPTQISCA